ncbi:putative peptide modification system cyclase [Luteimonas sp. 8-5]|uniref:putative peptide modification system cyclase n=1 Tax=Luteimonas sp. 8-5 TaxID=3039387 RepID=UPI002436D03F|nr:putative peptide modification system cyclase [Luteimonas sp. 8-5]MDG6348767.1 putative peptide modification system cyclase [Luteimonas sp. 8-5]
MNAPDSGIGNDSGPQVRTLLLTDLCDSTTLVERLGDNEAAELFRAHDRLVLKLQQQWHGRLIDRSDGLLLLFERPIDGLGFAMDYVRGLRDLGEQHKVARHGVELQARAGLHVGEVLTWRNSDAAVNVGAKPLEVEGLAKPMAGRLMTLARPGQILLSATAEPLAHRAARELGERGEHLLWKSHGRWRFKGVPQPQDIYEVGEPGIAPLRAPQQNRAKAWRDIPLWRRPAALAAELLLVAGLAGGTWFMTRPQPAIAFGERDWVVVADLRNLTGDAMLDDSLEQAFRISLEQSRYVNVLSDLKARDTLARMRRKPDTLLDRAVASEIALRDGARAVILPTVAEIGGHIRVSAEVIDPHTQTTVYAASADGNGAQSTLASIDKVSGELRGKLGEALEAIHKNSMSLPSATTGDLDALKAYAVGRKQQSTGDQLAAKGCYERAVERDPQFALAWSALASLLAHTLGEFGTAARYFDRAAQLRDRLSPRESLKLDVAMARLGPPAMAIEKADQLLALYPDELSVHLSLAQLHLWERNDAESALVHARAASAPPAQRLGLAHYMQGIALVALERPDAALGEFARSRELGYDGARYSLAYAHAMRRDWDGVARALEGQRVSGAYDRVAIPAQAATFAADQRKWEDALALAGEAVDIAVREDSPLYEADARIRRMTIEIASRRLPRSELSRRIREELAWLESNAERLDAELAVFRPFAMSAYAVLAARIDDARLLQSARDKGRALPQQDGYPLAGQLQTVLGAELERIQGKPGDATRDLRKLAGQPEALALVHATLRRSELAAGNADAAARETGWLVAHRGRAYVERPAFDLLSMLSVIDSTLDEATALSPP